MYGDMMYCNNCGKPFMDVWRGHDTRTNKKVLSNCPHCKSCSIINASQFMEEWKNNNGRINANQHRHSASIFYQHIKRLHEKWLKTWVFIKPSPVFLTKKESANFDNQR